MYSKVFAAFWCLLISVYCSQEHSGKKTLFNYPLDYNTAELPRSTFQIPVYLAVSTEKVTFYEALKQCNSMGLELASILSEKEQHAVEKYISTQKPLYGAFEGYWIAGVRRSLDLNDFAWLTKGKPVEFQRYTGGGILSNSEGIEGCLEFAVDGPTTMVWNDIRCDQKLNFICQNVAPF